jgi:anti-sigma regulatory factor (Ser/Thr protein kinase)
VRREVFLILKESVTNVVKHAECTRVEIEFVCDRRRLRLRVSDNGRGFQPSGTYGRQRRRQHDAPGGGARGAPGRRLRPAQGTNDQLRNRTSAAARRRAQDRYSLE